jgi:hypothetical protein
MILRALGGLSKSAHFELASSADTARDQISPDVRKWPKADTLVDEYRGSFRG